MNEPTVCAIMLTRDRPELAKKAVECFRAQTYAAKALLIYNTGEEDSVECGCSPQSFHVVDEVARGKSIGELRNLANGFKFAYPQQSKSDILIHWDDDDWSHPNRIAEQVALLQASGADCVGYNEMLFWREMVPCDCEAGRFGSHHYGHCSRRAAEAWLYSVGIPKPTLGTSLCYWRKIWERKPFNPKLPSNSQSTGEDWDFIQGLKVEAISSLTFDAPRGIADPMMIARIHGANSTRYNLEDATGKSWKRVPEWDNRVKEILG